MEIAIAYLLIGLPVCLLLRYSIKLQDEEQAVIEQVWVWVLWPFVLVLLVERIIEHKLTGEKDE